MAICGMPKRTDSRNGTLMEANYTVNAQLLELNARIITDVQTRDRELQECRRQLQEEEKKCDELRARRKNDKERYTSLQAEYGSATDHLVAIDTYCQGAIARVKEIGNLAKMKHVLDSLQKIQAHSQAALDDENAFVKQQHALAASEK